MRHTRDILAIAAAIALVAPLGCRAGDPATSTLAWDSPRMLEVEREWTSLMSDANRTRGPEGVEKYGFKNEKLYKMLDAILTKRLTDADLRSLVARCGSVPLEQRGRSRFADMVLEHMVAAFVASGDRESLVRLLSIRFPDPMLYSFVNVETYLVALGIKGRKLKDSILVLGEAYSKSREPYVRHMIADAVRRAFTASGVRGKDDAEFVKNAMEWYKKEKPHLALNYISDYNPFPMQPWYDVHFRNLPGASVPDFEKHAPLFVEKASVPKRERSWRWLD
jgi:hypothetical protein